MVTEAEMEEIIEEQRLVAESMMANGGGFVSKLGAALMHADLSNMRRIKKAFPDYWEQYKNLTFRTDTPKK